jgi:hypothetical protein
MTFKKIKVDNEKMIADNVVDIEEESPDIINVDIEYEDEGKSKINEKVTERKESTNIVSNILTSDIPADEWQRELERVSAKLKIDYNNSSYNYKDSEWRTHIDGIKTNEQNFAKSIPDSRSILENLSGEIDRSLEKIRKKEAMISKNFTHIVLFYLFLRFLIIKEDRKKPLPSLRNTTCSEKEWKDYKENTMTLKKKL